MHMERLHARVMTEIKVYYWRKHPFKDSSDEEQRLDYKLQIVKLVDILSKTR